MFLGIIIVVLFVLFAFTCYKKAPPTAAIVVTGFGLKKPKVVCGKGTFVIPVLQRADKLNMRLLKIDVKTPETGVKTKEGVSLWIDSVVTIQVYSDNSTVLDSEVQASGAKDVKEYITGRQQSAISNFLGIVDAILAIRDTTVTDYLLKHYKDGIKYSDMAYAENKSKQNAHGFGRRRLAYVRNILRTKGLLKGPKTTK